MEIHIKIVGFLMIALSVMHIGIPRFFGWRRDFAALPLITRQIVYVHTFFIAFVMLLIGLLCLLYAHDLIYSSLGHVVLLGLFAFCGVRLLFQFLVYSPKVWKGKRFETVMHIVFSILWLYFTTVLLIAYLAGIDS